MKTNKDDPIIVSLLDTDLYKLTMGQLVWQRYADVPVTYDLTNRTTSVRLADYVDIDELRMQLDHVRTLRVTHDEIRQLREVTIDRKRLFCEAYLHFLATLRLPEYRLERRADGQYDLTFAGPWSTAIYWEIPGLAITNELYFAGKMRTFSDQSRREVYERGSKILDEKIDALIAHPEIAITDFGLRRRFSRDWHYHVDSRLTERLPPSQFLGTSCVASALEHQIQPIGTMAHELFMTVVAMAMANHGTDISAVRAAVQRVLNEWWEMYGANLSVILPDTFGSADFLASCTEDQLHAWKGFRQDSGDPFAFGEMLIARYRHAGIDPMTKLCVFSDGLDLPMILKLSHFKNRIRVSFGWGTLLTNDMGFKPLSLVIKATQAMGEPTVKLSDNPAKALGPTDHIRFLKQAFHYRESNRIECSV